MNYEDFPILSNADYDLLKENFNSAHDLQEKTIEDVLNLLHSFYTCSLTTTKLNKQILSALANAKQICSKQYSMLASIFNLNPSHNTIENLNLFAMIKQLLLASDSLFHLAENTNKLYYKKIFLKSSQELIVTTTDILSGLEHSQFITFRYM